MAAPSTVTQVHLFTVGNTQYDLRKVVYWRYSVDGLGNAAPMAAPEVLVWFGGVPDTKPVTFIADDFNTAKAASLAAAGG